MSCSNLSPRWWCFIFTTLATITLSPAALSQQPGKPESRDWTSAAGSVITGTLVGYRNGVATIAAANDRSITVRAEQLSEADQKYLAAFAPGSGTHWASVEKIVKGMTGTAAKANSRPGKAFAVAPLVDQPIAAIADGSLKTPYKIRVLVPPGSPSGSDLVAYTYSDSDSSTIQSIERFGLQEGYNEIEIKALGQVTDARYGLGQASTVVYVFAVDKDGGMLSNIALIKVNVE